jgi:hypothetical protein
VTVSFRVGDEHGWIAASVSNSEGYPGLPEYLDWKIEAECGDFRGDFMMPLTNDDVAGFWAALVSAFDATADGEYRALLGEDRAQAAQITMYRQRGSFSHAVAELTPRGSDPIPQLTMWLQLDEAEVRSTAESVLGSLA